jgi:dTDP-4-dehydrorhamnose reductase
LLKERESLTVVADQRGSPTWTRDLAGVVRTIIESGSEAYGIFHFTDEGDISWYEFACSIRDMGREQGMIPPGRRIIPISTEEYPAKAARPPYSVLSKAKIRSIFGVVPPRWDDSLREFLRAGGGAWTGL